MDLLRAELPFTRSDFEAAFLDLCDRHGLARPHTNVRVHGHEVDAHWPDRRLVVELDSYEFHGTRAAFERDKERDAELHSRGMTTLRFTLSPGDDPPSWVAAKLSAARA